MNNAYTASEETNYYFQIDNSGFEKALLIFSKMFAEPLFDISYMEKEMNAVNSEHEKNLNSDIWRINRLLQSLSKSEHPFNHFSTGSLETFKNVTNVELNKQLRMFYNKYYRSNNMKLSVISNKSLDELQSLIKSYFTEIRLDTYISDKANNNTSPLYGNLFPIEKPYDNINKIVWYKKLADGKSVEVHFPLAPVHDTYKTKPYDYIEYLLKYTGEKSLISILRERGLANKIDASLSDSNSNFAMFSIKLDLTNQGFMNLESVISLLFGYLNKVKSEKISVDLYSEIKKINDLAFNFAEKKSDITNLLTSLSGNLFIYDYNHVRVGDYLHSLYDENILKQALDSLTLDNILIMVYSSEEVAVPSNATNSYINFTNATSFHEPWYGSEYKVIDIDKEFLNSLKTNNLIKDTLDINKDFQIRQRNEYISEMTGLVSPCNSTCPIDEYSEQTKNITPIALYDQDDFKSFYKIDNTFRVPKAMVELKILHPLLKKSKEDFTNFLIFSTYLDYKFTTLMSDAKEAGNSVYLDFSNDGLDIEVFCFKDLTQKIVNMVVNELFNLKTDKATFAIIVDLVKKRLTNAKLDKPYQKNKSYFNKMMKFNYTHYTDLSDITAITYESFADFKSNISNDLSIDALFYGSINKDEIQKISDNIRKYLKPSGELKSLVKDPFYIVNSVFLQRQLDSPITYQYKSEVASEMNHAVTRYYQIGQVNPEMQLNMLAVRKCIGNVFYHNLRTVHQLGYIASADSTTVDNIMYYKVTVQGSKERPRGVEQIIDDVFQEASKKVKECEGGFGTVTESIREMLTKVDSSMKDRGNRIWNEISVRTYNYNKRQIMLSALDSVKFTDVVHFFNYKLLNNKARISIHHYAGNSGVFEEVEDISDESGLVAYTNDVHVTKGLSYIKPVGLRRKEMRLKKNSKVRSRSIMNTKLNKMRN
jgi:insulysin